MTRSLANAIARQDMERFDALPAAVRQALAATDCHIPPSEVSRMQEPEALKHIAWRVEQFEARRRGAAPA